MFTYKRPNEISSTAGESFLAEGPTNEILDVYVSFDVSGLLSAFCVLFLLRATLRANKQHTVAHAQLDHLSGVVGSALKARPQRHHSP